MRVTHQAGRIIGAAFGLAFAALLVVAIAGALVGAHQIAIEIRGERDAP